MPVCPTKGSFTAQAAVAKAPQHPTPAPTRGHETPISVSVVGDTLLEGDAEPVSSEVLKGRWCDSCC